MSETSEHVLGRWRAYCADPAGGIDHAEFLTLLTDIGPGDLGSVLEPFPHADELEARVREVMAGPDPADALAPAELVEAALAHLAELRRLAREVAGDDELDGQLAVVRPEVVERVEIDPGGLFPDADVAVEVDDRLWPELARHHPASRGLHEALWGFTADFFLVWYLIGPLSPIPIDTAPYHRLWSGGGRYVIDNERLLVAPMAPG